MTVPHQFLTLPELKQVGYGEQAMSSLRSIAPDSSLVVALEKEVESLQTERREVESWLNQAESWAAHMGQWKATVGMPPQVRVLFKKNGTF